MSLILSVLERLERSPLRLPRSLVLFVAVGLVGLAVHTGLFSLLHRNGGFSFTEAWLSALATSTIVTWSLNRKFTFGASGRRSAAEILRYALVTAIAQSVSYGVSKGVLSAVPAPEIAVVAGAVVATAFSYTGQRFFTFAPYTEVEPIAVGDTPVLVAASAPDRSR